MVRWHDSVSVRTHEVISRVDSKLDHRLLPRESHRLGRAERPTETCATSTGCASVTSSGPLFLRLGLFLSHTKQEQLSVPRTPLVITVSSEEQLLPAPPSKPTQYLSLHQHSAFPPCLCGTLRPP